jgi:hypothetical protein
MSPTVPGRHSRPHWGESDDLDVDDAGEALAGREHALDAADPDLRVDVDVAPNVRGAGRDRLDDLARRLDAGVEPELPFKAALVGYRVGDPWPAGVGLPRLAEKAFVEMGVRIDQPR